MLSFELENDMAIKTILKLQNATRAFALQPRTSCPSSITKSNYNVAQFLILSLLSEWSLVTDGVIIGPRPVPIGLNVNP